MSHEIVELLTKINNAGTTVIMVTHEHDLVRSFQRRVIVIRTAKWSLTPRIPPTPGLRAASPAKKRICFLRRGHFH